MLYDELDPSRSMVVLRSSAFGAGRSLRIGSRIGERCVSEIHPRAVQLRGHGSGCWLGMFNARSREKLAREHAARTPWGRSNKAATKPLRPLSRRELVAGIRKIDDRTYRVDRGLLDKALAQRSLLAHSGRFQPIREGTRVRGLRVTTLPKGGLLSRLGVERGDLLRAINGYPLGDPASMLEAYGKLRMSPRVVLALERGQRLLSLSYTMD